MNNLTHINFKQNIHTMQVRMNFDVDKHIPEDSKVKLVCKLVEEMNLEPILSTYPRLGRKPVIDPISMLKIIIYCYSEGIVSVRNIEDFCIYDTRAHYILQGQKAPDHSTINRFIQSIRDYTGELLTQFVEMLLKQEHVDLKSLYIDGTKIESAAGRYTFVWRKTIVKYQKRLVEQLIQRMNLPTQSTINQVTKLVVEEFNRIRNHCKKEKIVFVYGTGKRKTQLQRDYETWEQILNRLNTYQEHLRIMGSRNSYSKTDYDATFMRMKEDHMMNGQLKPAYNIQFASSGAFIVGVMGSQKGNDLHTLKPFLEQMMPRYGLYLEKIVADAGYESVENYAYLKEKGLSSYIKPSNYESAKKKKKDIGRKENMQYLAQDDVYICKNGKKLIRYKDKTRTYESGYTDPIRVYRCTECSDCPYNKECIRSRKEEPSPTKTLEFSLAFEKYRKQSNDNITSKDGIMQRMNRSIQAEGMFSKLKDGLRYNRFRHRGMKAVISDITLMAIGINLNKLHTKITKNQSGVILYKKTS